MPLDWSLLEPGLVLAAHPRDAATLAELECEAVLNVCDFDEPTYLEEADCRPEIVQRPFADCWPVPFPWLAVAVLELAELRRRGKKTIVHCQLGRSRSPTVVALYWMAREGIDWQTAVARIEERRPCHLRPDGKSTLADLDVQGRIVKIVRRFLAGESALLHEYRHKAEGFATVCGDRPPDPICSDGEGIAIEDGLAVGESVAVWPVLAAHHFDRILIVRADWNFPNWSPPPGVQSAEHIIPADEKPNAVAMRSAVRQLDDWRRLGHRVFVHGPGEDLFAVTTICLWLMKSRDWDAASAIWYIGSRRPGICRFLELFGELNLESFYRDAIESDVR